MPAIEHALFGEVRRDVVLVGDGVFVADDGSEARDQVGRETRRRRLDLVHSRVLHTAARRSRSLIASPRPSFGIGITAICIAPWRRARADGGTGWPPPRRDRRVPRDLTSRPPCPHPRRQTSQTPAAPRRARSSSRSAAPANAARSARPACPARAAAPRSSCCGRSASLRPSTASISLAREPARPQQQRPLEAADDGRIQVRHWPDRRRRSGRSCRRDRLPHAAPWSARHGRTRWRKARPPACRRLQRMSRATGCAGTRTAMVSSPAVASSATGQSGGARQHQRQRPRPEFRRELFGVGIELGDPARGGEVGDMGDQRIERRPSLGEVEPRDRLGIGGVGAEPVNGFGRERDEPALGKAARAAAAAASRACQNRSGFRPDRHGSSGFTCNFASSRVPCGGPMRTAISRPLNRSVAQSGRAPRSGRGGRRFKSCHSDQIFQALEVPATFPAARRGRLNGAGSTACPCARGFDRNAIQGPWQRDRRRVARSRRNSSPQDENCDLALALLPTPGVRLQPRALTRPFLRPNVTWVNVPYIGTDG